MLNQKKQKLEEKTLKKYKKLIINVGIWNRKWRN
jgi:hypothetical protein